MTALVDSVKIKSLKLRLLYFFRQRIHGKDPSDNMSELVRPESEWERAEGVVEAILRWADDGGKTFELGNNQTTRFNPDAARKRTNN